METTIYLAKSGLILFIFYGVYVLFLRKETLFISNRLYLLSGILAAICLPFWSITKKVFVEAPTLPNIEITDMAVQSVGPAQEIASSSFSIDWWWILIGIYVVGIVVMTVRFLKQWFALTKLLKTYSFQRKGTYKYVAVDKPISPFSFFNYIVYNPTSHTEEELGFVLQHEQAHARQWHSLDLIFSNVLLIIRWLNPIAWLYKKSMEENLEYLADSATIQDIPSKTQYQLTLVKASSAHNFPMLTHPFYESFIKKRIIMLNKNQSRKRNALKTMVILPLLTIFLWSFNVKEEITYLEENTSEKALTTQANNDIPLGFSAASSDAILDVIESYTDKNHPSSRIKISDRVRNESGQLIGFSFLTKFEGNDRFYKRFERKPNETPFTTHYQISFLPENTIRVKETGKDAVHFLISKEKLSFQDDFSFEATHVKLREEDNKMLGDNPLYILNGKQVRSSELPKNTKIISKGGGITGLTPKEGQEAYGDAGKDGVFIVEGNAEITKNTIVEEQNLSKEFRFRIHKDMTNDELDKIKEELSSEHDIDMSYSVRRNSKNEIISIALSYTSSDRNGNYSVSNDSSGIEEFYFYMKGDEAGFWSEAAEARKLERKAAQKVRKAEIKARAKERKAEMKERKGLIKSRAKEMEEREVEIAEHMERSEERMAKRRVEVEERFANRREHMEEREVELKERLAHRRHEMKEREVELKDRLAHARATNRSHGQHSNLARRGNGERIIIPSDATEADLKALKADLKTQGIDFNYRRVKRNDRGEITAIKYVVTSKGSKVTASMTGDGEPIEDIVIDLDN